MIVLLARNEWSVGTKSNRADVNRLVLDYLVFWKPNPLAFNID